MSIASLMLLAATASDRAATQQRRVDCVLSGMKAMTDLRFGFVGNEADTSGS